MARWVRVLTRSGGAAAGAAIAAGVTLLGTLPQALFWTLPFLAAYAAGLWAVKADPGNRAAIRLLGFGVLALAWIAASDALLLWVHRSGPAPGFTVANVGTQMLGLLMAASLCGMLVRYPDGIPRLRAESWLIRTMTFGAFVLPLGALVGNIEPPLAWILDWGVEAGDVAPIHTSSPLYVTGLSWLGAASAALLESALALYPVLAVAVVVPRFRRLDREQRTRMAWPLQAVLLLLLMSLGDVLAARGVVPPLLLDVAEVSCLVLLSLSLGVGIARPDLFDVLGTVRRTMTFLLLSAAVVLGYVVVAVLTGATLGRDNLRVALVVAVVVALALEPLRRTLVRGAGRVAFGEQVSREDLLVRIGATLEHTLDPGELAVAIAQTTRDGLGAAWVTVTVDGEPTAHVGRRRDGRGTPAMTATLTHGDEVLGAIESGPLLRGRIDPSTRALLETLARQAALALTNARLAERLVAAEESARRRLERDLHDGAQQDLAALLTRIGLARSQLNRGEPEQVSNTLETIHGDTQLALANLRELASGIHPTVLSDRGLVEAIEARAARLPLQVHVHAGPAARAARFSASVESAAYFFVCEAVANTLKHAAAESVVVSVRLEAGVLRVEVSDDGVGFDPGRLDGRPGLSGLTDRLAALGGTLRIGSTPGEGTCVRATFPVQP